MPMKTYLDEPNISEENVNLMISSMFGGRMSTVGPHINEFEHAIAEYLGDGVFCTAVNSGTAALFVALKMLDVGHGDEVIIPATTFIATSNAVTMTGAKPVIVDIDKDTWNIDPVEIEKAITPKTRAIIPVHLYGNPCDMDRIMDMAKRYNLYVIEDAAESLGATYNGKHMATIGHIGCLSFNRNKVITTGGGGMVVTKDYDLSIRIKEFVNQGRNKFGEVNGNGFNFGMTNQNAALGLSQLNRFEKFLTSKNVINDYYYKFLEEQIINKTIKMQYLHSNAIHSFWFNAVKIDTKKINKSIMQIENELKDKGIPTRRIFPPLQCACNASDLYINGLCLPSSTLNTYKNIEYVCRTLLEVLDVKQNLACGGILVNFDWKKIDMSHSTHLLDSIVKANKNKDDKS